MYTCFAFSNLMAMWHDFYFNIHVWCLPIIYWSSLVRNSHLRAWRGPGFPMMDVLFIFRNIEIFYHFSTLRLAGSWDPSSKKTRTHWPCMYNTMVADVLAIQPGPQQPMVLSGYPRIFWFQHLGGWFNIKMPSYKYRKSHCGDKTILRPSYLHNRISYTGKMASLYWIRTQRVKCAVWKLSFCP